MALNASKVKGGGVPQDKLEAGVYPCRLVQVLDMGLQTQRPYKGEPKQPAYEISLTYEFTDEFMKDEDGKDREDKPKWLSETMPLHNLNAERAKSTQRYLALDPTREFGGDFSQLLGTPCNVTVVINPGKGDNAGKVYENIGGLATMRAKDVDKLPELVNPTKLFDLDAPDMEVFNVLPDWVQEKIKGNLEFAGSPLAHLLGDPAKDGIPGAQASVDEAELDDEQPF